MEFKKLLPSILFSTACIFSSQSNLNNQPNSRNILNEKDKIPNILVPGTNDFSFYDIFKNRWPAKRKRHKIFRQDKTNFHGWNRSNITNPSQEFIDWRKRKLKRWGKIMGKIAEGRYLIEPEKGSEKEISRLVKLSYSQSEVDSKNFTNNYSIRSTNITARAIKTKELFEVYLPVDAKYIIIESNLFTLVEDINPDKKGVVVIKYSEGSTLKNMGFVKIFKPNGDENYDSWVGAYGETNIYKIPSGKKYERK